MWVRKGILALLAAACLGASSPIGVEYGHSGITGDDESAAMLARSGIGTVKFADVFWSDVQPWDFASWCSIWPFSLISTCSYQWSALDADMQTWQRAGFTDIHMVLRAKHPNFTTRTVTPPPAFGIYVNLASNPPKADRWDDYGRFVAAVAERYDGDGVNDMPGLKTPVHAYEIESEQQTGQWWGGTVAEHLQLTRTARASILAADPRARIILGGVNFGNNLDDNPTLDQWLARLAGLPSPWNTIILNAVDFAEAELAASAADAYDIVEIHALSNWTGVAPAVQLLRNVMLANGFSKEIWIGDAASSPDLLFNANIGTIPYLPKDDLARRASILLNPSTSNTYLTTVAWIRAEQSILTARKVAAAFGAGARRINFCSPVDWPTISSLPFNGLLESSSGPDRPVLATLRLLAAATLSCSDSTKVPADGDVPSATFVQANPAVYVFETRCGGRFVLAWSDSGAVRVQPPIPITSAVQVPTVMGQSSGTPVPIVDGGFQVDRVPVLAR